MENKEGNGGGGMLEETKAHYTLVDLYAVCLQGDKLYPPVGLSVGLTVGLSVSLTVSFIACLLA